MAISIPGRAPDYGLQLPPQGVYSGDIEDFSIPVGGGVNITRYPTTDAMWVEGGAYGDYLRASGFAPSMFYKDPDAPAPASSPGVVTMRIVSTLADYSFGWIGGGWALYFTDADWNYGTITYLEPNNSASPRVYRFIVSYMDVNESLYFQDPQNDIRLTFSQVPGGETEIRLASSGVPTSGPLEDSGYQFPLIQAPLSNFVHAGMTAYPQITGFGLYAFDIWNGSGVKPASFMSLRQRQTLTANTGSWPLRQKQNGGASGSWPLRQR